MTDAQKYIFLYTDARRKLHDIRRCILKMSVFWFARSKQSARWENVTTRSINVLDDILFCLFIFRF